MTTTLTTKNLSTATAESLTWLTEQGFRYFKSFDHFRRKNENGFSYISINSVTHDRVNYHLAFYIGVQITEVENWIHNLMGETRETNHYDRTIWNYTVNIGPTSPHWQYPTRGTWTLHTLDDFGDISSEVSRFVKELAIPFVDQHQDALAIRRTLIENPGHATNIWPYRQILAIDSIYASPEQIQSDFALLDKRYEQYAPQPRQEFDKFVLAVQSAKNLA
jgi:hypothetical protein